MKKTLLAGSGEARNRTLQPSQEPQKRSISADIQAFLHTIQQPISPVGYLSSQTG